MKKEKPTWVLVADKTKAKIFEFSSIKDIPTELFEMSNPAGHLKEQDLASDRPGRAMHDPFRQRNSLPPHHKKTEQVTSKFIEEVLIELTKLSREGRFDELVLVAEPRLLGKFRDSLSNHRDLHIIKEIHHNLLGTPSGSLAVELQKYIHPEQVNEGL